MSATLPPKGTAAAGWTLQGIVLIAPHSTARSYAHVSGLTVLSAVEAPEGVPEYHVSVCAWVMSTRQKRVPTDEEIEQVRAAFSMGGAEEDNHGPGCVRHLWLRVDRDRQDPCPCKQDEERIVEGDRVRYEQP